MLKRHKNYLKIVYRKCFISMGNKKQILTKFSKLLQLLTMQV